MESSSIMEQAVKIDSTYCGECINCITVCPFEAVTLNKDKNQVEIDPEKCQACGICYGSCPSGAISSAYYDIRALLEQVKNGLESGRSALAVTCRGSAPEPEELAEIAGVGSPDDLINILLPCVGRVPGEFYLKAISEGVQKIAVVPCGTDYCRFGKGSIVAIAKALMLKNLINQFGYDRNAIIIQPNEIKIDINPYKCIGCGNCEYVCPKDAPYLVSPGVAEVHDEKCMGCGRCISVCPAFAINLKGSDYKSISNLIGTLSGSTADKPSLLVFCCSWCEYDALDAPITYEDVDVKFIALPCSGRVDELHVLEAYQRGFDGVLVVSCKDSSCRFAEDGTAAETKDKVRKIKKKLDSMAVGGERLDICLTYPNYIRQFEPQLRVFADGIKKLGKTQL